MSRVPEPVKRAIEALHLPAMPQIVLRFHEEADGDSASVEKLAQLVLRDPALAARVLTAANSAAFRRSGELRSIKECLLALGPRMVRTIAAGVLVHSTFPDARGLEPRDLAAFWRHSVLVAEIARATAAELGAGEAEREEAYLAGLLHDIGQLLLLGGLGESYEALLARAKSETELSTLEDAELATNHGEIGAWLVDQWELPSLMADAILFHHLEASEVASLDRLGRIVWGAHVVSMSPPSGARPDFGIVERLLGIGETRFGELRQEALDRVSALARMLAPDLAATSEAQTLPLRAHPRPFDPAALGPAEGSTGAGLQAAVLSMAALQALPRDVATLGSEADLVGCAREAARILFGVQRVAFLLVQPGGGSLRAAAGAAGGAGSGALQRLDVPLQPGLSLCADAALARQSRTTLDAEPSNPVPATDQQITRALGAERLWYAPLLARGRLLGVMAMDVSAERKAAFVAHATRLRDFANVVADNLDTWRQIREREERIEAEVSAHFVLQGQRVAHEVNNPLAIIRNYLTLISNDASRGEPGRSQGDIDVLREEIDRLAGIVRNLTVDASTSAVPEGQVDLNRLLEGMRTLYEGSLFRAAGVRLELTLPHEPALACGDRDNIKQIVFNLWKNAAEAMGSGGGTLFTEVTPHVNCNGSRYTQLRIRDSGPGLPPAVLDTLFRPLDGGTPGPRPSGRAGLGLSIVLALVERNRGTITCESRAGEGTTFTLLIPETSRTDR